MAFVIRGACLACLLLTVVVFTACENQQRDERLHNSIAVVGRIFVYTLAEEGLDKQGQYEVFQKEQTSLPQWLSYDAKKASLTGVPSWRDRGELYLDFKVQDGSIKHSLKIDIKDLRDGDLQPSSGSNNTKIRSYPQPKCPNGLPVAAASIIFDYHLGKLSGQARVEILNKVSDFVDVDVKNLHLLAGKGHNTAFGFKDVITVTAGPGNVADSKQPGVVVSWQIGCGIDIPGARIASFLKSSAETGAFSHALGLPVTEWHIAVGHPKEPRHRARRQAVQGKSAKITQHSSRRNVRAIQPTPTPTLTAAPPTSIIASVTITVTRTSSVVPTSTVTPTTTPIAPTTTEEPTTTEQPTTTQQATTTPQPTTTEKPTTSEEPTTAKEPPTTREPTTTEKPTTTEQPTTKTSTTTPLPSTTKEESTTQAESTTTEVSSTTVKTSQESSTTEELIDSSTRPTTSPVAVETVVPSSTVPSNAFPTLKNSIDRLDVYRGQGLIFHIPHDTFYDKEDMLTPNLTLVLKTPGGTEPLPSWIGLDAEKQIIYAFPVDKDTVKLHNLFLIATDSKGAEAVDAIEVNVLDDTQSYSHQFKLTLNYNFTKFSSDLNIRMDLLNKLAKYFNLNVSNIRIREFVEGSVRLKFQFDTVPEDECNFPLREQFENDDGDVSPSLKEALSPEFPVTSGSFEGLGPCAGDSPVVVSAATGSTWKTYVIIPVVILVIVLLVIVIALFLVMRSRRKRKLSLEDKNVFVFQKKPAVLQEEYEVKERLLKQPLVLPNEKPPLAPAIYPRSPSLSHANGDTPLTERTGYQAPTFTSFKSPSNQAGPGGNTPRKPTYSGYRLPPAYVPP